MEDFIKLENSIKRGVISNVYLIYGDQEYLKDLAVKKLTDYLLSGDNKDFNYDLFTDPVNYYQLVGSAEQIPVFSEKRLVVAKSQNLFNDNNEIGEEEMVSYLNQPNPGTCLVFVTTKIDARRKVIKLIKEKGEILRITSPKANQLTGWVEKQARYRGKKITPQAIEMLIAAVEDNLLLLEQEVEKASVFCTEGTIDVEHVGQTASNSARLNVFKITELVAERKAVAAVKLYQNMVIIGEYPVKILALLGSSFRQMLRAKLLLNQTHLNSLELSKELKVANFVAKKILAQQRHFDQFQLEEALKIIKNTDFLIKTGQRDQMIAVEMAIYQLADDRLGFKQ